jgi:drug/metabolite transporter (DMT)-like permease
MVPPATRLPAAYDAAPIAFLALVAGAMAMGISPIFVRFAEVGPFTSAFWRVGLALPALWLWAALERPASGAAPPDRSARLSVLFAGLLFAGDLTFWHLAIMNTSVANATFLATLAPVWVVLGSGLVLGERVAWPVFVGLALCLVGAAALIGNTWSVEPGHLDGDIYGIATSVFFGAYFLAVRRARRVYGAGRTLFLSSLVTAAVLLVEAVIMEDQMWPLALSGVAALFAMALVSHAGGQGLLAFALGHLPAAFSSLVIFLEAVAAACFAWIILGEAIGPIQAIGAVAIFLGISVARPRRTA